LEAGTAGWLYAAHLAVATLAVLAILCVESTWPWKLVAIGALALVCIFSTRHSKHLDSICILRLYGNGAITLYAHDGQCFPALLETGGWMTQWVTIVPACRIDRWKSQRIVVCASRNSAADYRQLLKRMRLGAGNSLVDGILRPP